MSTIVSIGLAFALLLGISYVWYVLRRKPEKLGLVYYIPRLYTYGGDTKIHVSLKVVEIDRTSTGASLVKVLDLVACNPQIDLDSILKSEQQFFVTTMSLHKSKSQDFNKMDENDSIKMENKLLEKIHKDGLSSLSPYEKHLLDNIATKK